MKKAILENTGHGSLGNKIFNILRDRILNEEYAKGQKLNEVALSKELEISRTPIREALKQLELECLVRSEPNKGVFVIGFSHRDINDMLEIRYVLEALAVELAIERINSIQLDKIKESYLAMEEASKVGDQDKFNDANIAFHESIYKGTQSQYFEQLLRDINYYIHVTSRHSIKQPNRLDSAAIEHREIYEAILAGDKKRAVEKVKKHIRKTQFLVKHYYESKDN